MSYTVYAYRDGAEIIYIGCTSQPVSRRASHKYRTPWWTGDLKFEVLSEHDEREVALGVELALIQYHRPRHNIIGNPDVVNDFVPLTELGVTYRQLDYWCRQGIITLQNDAHGSGSRRRVSEVENQAIAALVNELNAAEAHLEYLRSGIFFTEAVAALTELDRSGSMSRPTDRLPEWADYAACQGRDPELFFPPPGGSASYAKAICRSCDVRRQCLSWAMEHDEMHGIWGMTTGRERRRMRGPRRAA